MTKRELEKNARKLFFQAAEEKFGGTLDVEQEMGGRWIFWIEGVIGEYSLQHISYGGDIISCAIKGDDNYDDMEVIAEELDNLWKSSYLKVLKP